MLFPEMGLLRTLALEGEPSDKDAARATRLFGSDEWERIFRLRKDPESGVDGWAARKAYLNLLRWRLQAQLGYRWTHPLEVRNLHNRPVYEMVFATDHDAGTRIMSALYSRAEIQMDALMKDARAEASGKPRLFPLSQVPAPAPTYVYDPPFDPELFPNIMG